MKMIKHNLIGIFMPPPDAQDFAKQSEVSDDSPPPPTLTPPHPILLLTKSP